MLTNPALCSVCLSGLDIGPHLEDIDLALAEVSPLALLEALLGETREVNPVKSLHVVAEGFEDPSDDPVLAGVDLDAETSVVLGVDIFKLVGLDVAVVEVETLCEDLLLVGLLKRLVEDDW